MNVWIGCVWTAALALLVNTQVARGGNGRALVVGLDYTGSDNYLPGCEGDARSMALTLSRQFGFADRDIQMLLGGQATKAHIIGGLHQLARVASANDITVFFYSGHGSQVEDANGDEEDGLDETICPWDIVDRPSEASLMTDDEIGTLIDAIPGQVVVILDSCHSGTATRNLTRCGHEKFFQSRGGKSPKEKAPDRRQFAELTRKGREVLIAGCASTESSQVIQVPVGSRRFRSSALTYFLNEGLRGPADANGDGRISYREIVTYTKARIDAYFQTRSVDESIPSVLGLGLVGKSAAQSVQLEGGAADQPFLSMPPRPFYSVISDVSGNHVTLDAGAIHGLGDDMELSVKSSSGQSIGTLRISKLAAETAEAEVISGSAADFKGKRASISGVVLPELVQESGEAAAPVEANRTLTARIVARSQGAALQVARGLGTALVREKFLRLIEDEDAAVDVAIVLAVSQNGPTYSVDAALQRRSGQITDPVSTSAGSVDGLTAPLAAELVDKLSSVYTSGILAEWTNPCPSFAVALSSDRGDDRPTYRIGESFSIRVTATADCFLTILDVGTSGQVSVLYPNEGATPVRLSKGAPLRLPVSGAFKATGPPGMDRLKVIATRRPMNPADLVRTKGVAGRGILASLSRSLHGAIRSKSAGDAAVPCSEWAEASLAIQITP